jgi:hypothetical protein
MLHADPANHPANTMSKRAIFRPATDLEKDLATHFCQCSFPPASWCKRFAGQLYQQMTRSTDQITEKQARLLHIEAYRYRRQMPGRLVPKSPPEGYQTTRQRTAAAIAQSRINQMKEATT